MEIRKVILQTVSPESLVRFYGDVMNLPVKNNLQTGPSIGVGNTTLVFKQAEVADPFYHFAINIPANKIEEAKAWLLQRVELIWIDDYKSDIAEFVNWHARSVYFFDPAGNIVELIARFDMENETSEPFGPDQFLSISEMGLVFKPGDLNSSTDQLLEKYNLNYFDKQPPLAQFKAVGDDKGLFIIVPENRNWYPTKKQSGIFPMQIDFETAGKKHRLIL